MNAFHQLFLILSLFGLLSCNGSDGSFEENTVNRNSESADVVKHDSIVEVELHYRYKDNIFAKELQQLFSQYYTSQRNREDTRHMFHRESQNFMYYPQTSQRILNEDRFFDMHKPMVIAIYTQDNDTIAKLNFTRVDSLGIATSMATVNFGITRFGGDFLLQNMVFINSQGWETKHIGNIEYHFPKSHVFTLQAAEKMQEFNLYMAQLFEIDPIDVKYFICESNIELRRLQGFDFLYDMFNMNNSSGLSDGYHKIIYAGNGSEYYPHELIHLYTAQWDGVPRHHEWFEEGLATFLGGSRDRPLEWHLSELSEWLEQNDSADLSDPFSLPHQINETTGSIYVIGGLICKLAYDQGGMAAVKKLFMAGPSNDDFYTGIDDVFGIQKAGLDEFLRTNITNYGSLDKKPALNQMKSEQSDRVVGSLEWS